MIFVVFLCMIMAFALLIAGGILNRNGRGFVGLVALWRGELCCWTNALSFG